MLCATGHLLLAVLSTVPTPSAGPSESSEPWSRDGEIQGQCHPFLPHGKAHYSTRIGECPETGRSSNNPHPPYTACRAPKDNVQQGEESPRPKQQGAGSPTAHHRPSAGWEGSCSHAPAAKGCGELMLLLRHLLRVGRRILPPPEIHPQHRASLVWMPEPQPGLEETLSDWLPIPRRLGMGIGSQSELLQELRQSSPALANSFQVREDRAEGTQKLRAASLPSSSLL